MSLFDRFHGVSKQGDLLRPPGAGDHLRQHAPRASSLRIRPWKS